MVYRVGEHLVRAVGRVAVAGALSLALASQLVPPLASRALAEGDSPSAREDAPAGEGEVVAAPSADVSLWRDDDRLPLEPKDGDDGDVVVSDHSLLDVRVEAPEGGLDAQASRAILRRDSGEPVSYALVDDGAGGLRIEGEDGTVALEDGRYELSLLLTSEAGTVSEATYAFVVDTVPPDVALSARGLREGEAQPADHDLASADPANPLYLQEGLLSIVVDEADRCEVAVRDAGGTHAVEAGQDGSFAWRLPEGPNPELEVVATDAAGNVSVMSLPAASLVCDLDVPQVDAVVDAADGTPVPRDGARLGAGHNAIDVVVSDSDLPAGTDCLLLSYDGDGAIELGEVSRSEGGATLRLSIPDGAYASVSVAARDRAGRVSEVLTISDVVVDTDAPTFSVSLGDGGLGGEGAVTVEGRDYVGAPIGMRVVVDERHFDPSAFSVRILRDGEPLEVQERDWSSEGDLRTYACLLDGGDQGAAEYEVDVRGTDAFGNVAVLSDDPLRTAFSTERPIVVDLAAPEVEITSVRDGVPADERETHAAWERGAGDDEPARDYFRAPTSCEVRVRDRSFDPRGTTVDGEVVTWEVREDERGTYHSHVLAYGEGDHSTPVVEARDLAGNATRAGEPVAFTVDLTDPVVLVDPTLETFRGRAATARTGGGVPDGVRDGDEVWYYFDSVQELRTTVLERNWDAGGRDEVVRVEGDAASTSGPVRVADGRDLEYLTRFPDGTYRFRAGATDLSGRSATSEEYRLVVDTVRPVVDIDFGADDPEPSNGRYYAGDRVMTVTVRERNFDPARFVVAVERRLGSQGEVVRPTGWRRGDDGQTHVLTYTFHEDGAYRVEVSGTDLAGNPIDGARSTTTVGEFVIDETPPQVSVSPTRVAEASLGGVDCYGGPVAWELSVSDRNLDVGTAEGTVAEVERGNASVRPAAEWGHGEVSDDGVVTWTTTVVYDELEGDEAGQASLSPRVHAVDLASNAADAGETPFCVDRTAPSVLRASVSREPSAVGGDGDYLFYDGPTSMRFDFHDPYGIASAVLLDPDGVYEVQGGVSPGSVDGFISVDLVDGARSERDAEFGRDVTLVVTDLVGHSRTWTIDRQGNVRDDKGSSWDNVSLDGRGLHPMFLVEDLTSPHIAISGVEAGTYHDAAQLAHVAVDELNLGYLRRFDPARAAVVVTRREGSEGGSTTVTELPVSALVGSGSVWEADLRLEEDGHYRLVGRLSDFAGNGSNVVEVGEFTIDTTDPVATVSWDNTDVRNGRYYDAPRVATVRVVEHNFDPSLFAVSTSGVASGWSDEGDAHVCTVSFGEGVHHLEVSGRDLAGNACETVSEPEFVVDTTPPTLVLGGVAQSLRLPDGTLAHDGGLRDHGAYNGIVAPQVTVADEANFDAGSVTYSLVGGKLGDVTDSYPHSVSASGVGESVLYADLGRREGDGGVAYDVDADDVYVLHASAADLAGNVSEASLAFSVNRFGSNYLVSMDGGGGTGTPLAEAPTILVREINVSGSASEADHQVVKEHANATSAIPRDDADDEAGYRLEAQGAADATNPYGWSEYLYTVRRGNFGSGSDSDVGDGGQGVYRVNVMSQDLASNSNSTASYWQSDVRREEAEARRGTVEFTLDEVGPEIDEVRLPGPLALARSYRASFHVTDAIAAGEGDVVEVRVDGEPVEVEGPDDGRGTFSFAIDARPLAPRGVEIRVTDYAGRTASVSRGRLYVTDLVAEGGALAATVLVAALVRRRAGRQGRGTESHG